MKLGDLFREARAGFVQEIVGWTRMMDPNAFPDYPSYWRNIPVPLSNWSLDFPRAVGAIPIIYACVDMIASDAAGLPVRFFRTDKSGKKTKLDPEPGNVAWLWDRMNKNQSRFEATQELQSALDTGGSAYIYIEDFGQEKPSKDWELWSMPPHLVKPTVGDRRERIGYEFMGGVHPVIIPANKVIFFRYFHPQFTPLGMSPLEAARVQYEARYFSGRWNRAFYEKGAQASGIFTTTDPDTELTPTQVKFNQDQLMKLNGGVDNAMKATILQGLKFERRGMTHSEMNFIEAAELTDADICRVYGIPPVLMGIKKGGGLSDAGASTDLLRYWEHTQKKRANLRDAVITKQLCSRFGPEFVCETDFSMVPALQDKLLTQMKAIVIATGRPIMTVNEGRKPVSWLEPIEDDPSADELFMPQTVDAGTVTKGPGEPDDGSDSEDPKADTEDGVKEPAKPKAGRSGKSTAHSRVRARRRESAILARHERKFARSVRAFFTRQQDIVEAAIRHAYQMAGYDTEGRSAKKKTRTEVSIDWNTVLGPNDHADVDELERIFNSLIEQRGEEQLAEIGVEVEIELNKAAGKRYAERFSAELIGQINNTTRNRLRDGIVDVIAGGGTFAEASRTIRDVFDGRRDNADTIARTEMLGAYNFASLDAAKQSGVVVGKSWMTAEDELVREAHSAAEEDGPIGIDEAWTMAGNDGPATLAFPGDPDGPPELVCNCRCVLQYETDAERVREVKDTFRRTRERIRRSSLDGLSVDEFLGSLWKTSAK